MKKIENDKNTVIDYKNLNLDKKCNKCSNFFSSKSYF